MISRLIWEQRIRLSIKIEEGIVLNEPSVVAIRTHNGQKTVTAVGSDAKKNARPNSRKYHGYSTFEGW